MIRVLIVDDDAGIRTVVAQALRRAGCEAATADTLAGLERALHIQRPDVLITDVVLPDGDGLEHLPRFLAEHGAIPVIVLSAQNTLSTAVRATGAGAYEYLPKPFDLDTLIAAVRSAARRGRSTPADDTAVDDRSLPLIGRSPAMQHVYRVIARVVGTDLTILVSGESGTGKELVARAIHDLGPRRTGPFVALNMAAIPRELIEAELFGHERGAFTGATQRSAGRFEQAGGGTLFLDEIGDMPIEAQTRLLRVLQSGEFTTVGGAAPLSADVRIVAASNRDLLRLVEAGKFREDLFYRLNVVPVALPPLRDRREDVPALAAHFLSRAAGQGLPMRRLDPGAIEALMGHDWPGNVRELENLMRRLAVLARDETIDATTIGETLGSSRPAAAARADGGVDAAIRSLVDRILIDTPDARSDGSLYDRVIAAVERPLIALMMRRHGDNQLQTARALGINRNTLRKRLDDLDLLPRDQAGR